MLGQRDVVRDLAPRKLPSDALKIGLSPNLIDKATCSKIEVALLEAQSGSYAGLSSIVKIAKHFHVDMGSIKRLLPEQSKVAKIAFANHRALASEAKRVSRENCLHVAIDTAVTRLRAANVKLTRRSLCQEMERVGFRASYFDFPDALRYAKMKWNTGTDKD
jgi:hypothetical protein